MGILQTYRNKIKTKHLHGRMKNMKDSTHKTKLYNYTLPSIMMNIPYEIAERAEQYIKFLYGKYREDLPPIVFPSDKVVIYRKDLLEVV